MRRFDVEFAIRKLEVKIGISLKDAIVTRIDFAVNVELKYAPKAYFALLGEHDRLERNPNYNGIYYYPTGMRKNYSRVLYIYNKGKETKKSLLPPQFCLGGFSIYRSKTYHFKALRSRASLFYHEFISNF